MVFSSIFFLFYFLPVVLVAYFLAGSKYRNLVLLFASLFFYSWGEPRFILIMLFSTVLDYSCGKGIDAAQRENRPSRAKQWLLLSIVVNLSLLLFFKYSNFIILNINSLFDLNIMLLNISLPIGISFYTFQTMSYSIDVYRKEVSAQENILDFATYVTLFPQLIAGPIVRYQTVAKELTSRKESIPMVSEGIKRFIIGLAKKVLLANTIGLLWRNIADGNVEMSVAIAWLGIIAFAFQIYFDFSGYSDMAIGLGKIFGFTFLENFNYPYMSRSITEFWRRWHISLGTWFKEYVYIPLGGGRNKQYRNIFIVWTLTGIWHGASWNFLVWGLLFAFLLMIEKAFLLEILDKIPRVFGHVYTLFFVLIAWVIFAFDSLAMGLSYLKIMFGLSSYNFINSDFLYFFQSNAILLIVLVIASTNIMSHFAKRNLPLKLVFENIYLVGLFLISVSFLVSSSYNPFLYFKF